MKTTVKIGEKKVTVDTKRPAVAKAVKALIEACATRTFSIGTILEHENGDEYLLAKVQDRAYLVNTDTGRCRNSRKVVKVQSAFKSKDGYYVEDLPCEKDKFLDPDNRGEFIEI
jgi:hypothetical protein